VHFRSRDKDGGHIIRSAMAENPMLYANSAALSSIEQELLPTEALHCVNREFCTFSRLWPRPWPDDLYIQTGPVFREDITADQCQGFQKL